MSLQYCENPNCNNEVEVSICCYQPDCGCQGLPQEPPVCSGLCYNECVKQGIYRI